MGVRSPSRRFFLTSATAGCAGVVLITLGAFQSGSPFTTDVRGSWPFRFTTAPFSDQWCGMLMVYSGIVVLLGAWYCLATCCPGRPLRHLYAVFGAWVAPLLFVPPLFSRDVYAYAALGQLTSRGGNPYGHSPASLHGPSFLRLVDPLWQQRMHPTGHCSWTSGRAMSPVAGNSVLATVEGYRVIALIGVLLIAASVPAIARSVGRQPQAAFVLAVLNPLVLLYLIGGAHNDALMLGLLVAGVAAASLRHPVIGILLCALAAEVKIPGLDRCGLHRLGLGGPGRRAGPSIEVRHAVCAHRRCGHGGGRRSVRVGVGLAVQSL